MGDHQVFQHGHAGEQPDILEGARHPRELGNAIVEQTLQQERPAVRVGEPHHADGRLVEPGDAIEHRSLAGTVGTDQRGDVAGAGPKRQVSHRDQTTEPHGQVVHFEHEFSRLVHPRPSPTGAPVTVLP